MSMSSIFRRLISSKIASSPILRRRKFCTTTAMEEVLRPSSSPYLMLPPFFFGGGRDMVYNFYSPAKDKVVSFNNRGGTEETKLMQDDKTTLVGSSHGWLALYNSSNRGMLLLNPVSGHRIDLPPLAGKPFSREVAPWKLIMSCPPDEEECRAVLIFNSAQKVAFCCLGRSSHWTTFGDLEERRYNDIVRGSFNFTFRYYLDFVYSAAQKRFMVLVLVKSILQDTLMVGIEWSRPGPTTIGNTCWGERLAYAYIMSVEESGQVFLVVRRFNNNSNNRAEYPEFQWDVYRIEDVGGLELCLLLDDLTFFVGVNHSIASPSPKLKRNCIYFATGDGQCIEVFDYKKKTRSPLYLPTHHQKTQSSMTWITPTFD
ncbi:hypothetical protein OROHE_000883 [Orobanche hederae]